MKFQRGQSVKTLIEKGTVKEGDLGVIDAVHEDGSYTVGFYATEDALLYSGHFQPEELTLYTKNKEQPSKYEEGDVVELLVALPSLEIGSIGKIVTCLEDGNYVGSFAIDSMIVPLLVPLLPSQIKKVGHIEETHHH